MKMKVVCLKLQLRVFKRSCLGTKKRSLSVPRPPPIQEAFKPPQDLSIAPITLAPRLFSLSSQKNKGHGRAYEI